MLRAHGQSRPAHAAIEDGDVRLLVAVHLGRALPHLVELAVVVEGGGACPLQLHHVEVFVRAAVAVVVAEEVAVPLHLRVVAARDDVDGHAAFGELVEGRDLARGERGRDETGPVGDEEAEPFGVGRGVAGDAEAVGPGRAVTDEDAVEAGLFVGLGEGAEEVAIHVPADQVGGGAIELRSGARADHPDELDHASPPSPPRLRG